MIGARPDAEEANGKNTQISLEIIHRLFPYRGARP